MIFLVSHIIFASLFALQVKHYQSSGRDMLAVGAINYIVAAIAAGVWVGYKGEFGISNATWIIGILCGIAYFVSYFFIINAVKSSGISITWSVVRLSVIVPVLFSIFYWKEQPNAFQIGGIMSVCVSLPLLSIRTDNGSNNRINHSVSFIIIALFLVGGGVGLAAKAFNEFSPPEQRQMYLLFLFGTAAIVSTSVAIVRKASFELKDVSFGIILGVCNLLAGNSLLLALARLPGMLVFPVAGSMSIILTTLAGVTFWRERLQKLTILGIAAAVIAVVLINLK